MYHLFLFLGCIAFLTVIFGRETVLGWLTPFLDLFNFFAKLLGQLVLWLFNLLVVGPLRLGWKLVKFIWDLVTLPFFLVHWLWRKAWQWPRFRATTWTLLRGLSLVAYATYFPVHVLMTLLSTATLPKWKFPSDVFRDMD